MPRPRVVLPTAIQSSSIDAGNSPKTRSVSTSPKLSPAHHRSPRISSRDSAACSRTRHLSSPETDGETAAARPRPLELERRPSDAPRRSAGRLRGRRHRLRPVQPSNFVMRCAPRRAAQGHLQGVSQRGASTPSPRSGQTGSSCAAVSAGLRALPTWAATLSRRRTRPTSVTSWVGSQGDSRQTPHRPGNRCGTEPFRGQAQTPGHPITGQRREGPRHRPTTGTVGCPDLPGPTRPRQVSDLLKWG